jgi:dTDP-4-amino-4,6-dideoxygalactose transaminase
VTAIPFNRPGQAGLEFAYLAQAIRDGHTSCGGPYSQRVEELLAKELATYSVLLTTSCTDALEMTALLLGVGPGDTVVVPSFTFTSTALAYVRQGARIRFCDIEPETMGLDPEHLAALMDDTVRAIVPVHYAGVPCRIDEILEVAAPFPDAAVVEDNAHGLFGSLRGKPLGTFGRFATLSFHETKNFICGEGGALVINQELDEARSHVLLDKGTNRRQFMLGLVDKYSWMDVGSSFGMSDLLAAFLLAQLEQRDVILARRRAVHDRYAELLHPVARAGSFRMPVVPPACEPAYHMFYVLLPDRSTRDHVLKTMRAAGIHATFHYVPLHSAPGGERFGDGRQACPVTDDVSGRLLRLPFFNDLRADEIDRVVEVYLSALDEAIGLT